MATFLFFLLLLFFLMPCSSPSTYISNYILEFRGFTGRTLLRRIACPVDFARKNYTALSNSCKEPNYEAEKCCLAFKELACPYWDQLGDPDFDCASTFFSYVNLINSKHPPGTLCHKGEKGLDCGPILNVTAPTAPSKSGARAKCTPASMLMITVSLLHLMFHLF